jgi:hypothetical protein
MPVQIQREWFISHFQRVPRIFLSFILLRLSFLSYSFLIPFNLEQQWKIPDMLRIPTTLFNSFRRPYQE